jgi:hypothetical protein
MEHEARNLAKRGARVGGSVLHLRHTIAVNDFFVRLHQAAHVNNGSLQWVGEVGCRAHYTDPVSHRPRLTPDGAGTLRVGLAETRFFLELDRGTERQVWLQNKFRRYLRHLGGRVGADLLNVLFVVPDDRRERLIHRIGQAAIRGAAPPCPYFWTATQHGLDALGPLGAVWARVPGGQASRARLSEMGERGQPPPSVSLFEDTATDIGLKAA